MADRPPLTIVIDGISYPCTSWQTSSAARTLERRYDSGFNGGMGFFTEKQTSSPNQIYHCVSLDPTTFPYIRMRKGERDQVSLTVTGADSDKPAYAFVLDGPSSIEYLYLANAGKLFKFNLGASGDGDLAFAGATPNVAEATKTITGGTAGRPVYFTGDQGDRWYIPYGDDNTTNQVLRIDAVAADDISNDTIAATDFFALHLATQMTEVSGLAVPRLWRAHETNKLAASTTAADDASFAGDTAVGDATFPIADLLTVGGELFVSKPNKPYRMDDQAQSVPVMEFVGATGSYLTNYQEFDGAQCGAHGPYVYWTSSTGLWRIWGDSALPIGPTAQPNWTPINLDSLTEPVTGWFSFAAWGQWAYATNASTGLYAGWVREDGTITWMGNVLSGNGTPWAGSMRCGIAVTANYPILWLLDTNEKFAVFKLELDGSMRRIATDGSAETERGGDNEQGQIWMPTTDFGEPEKQKRIRMMWLDIDNNEYANVDVEARMHRDRIQTSIQLGSDLTSADGPGHFEFKPTSQSTAITSSSTANPTVLTVTAHGFISGEIVTIAGHSSTPDINGEHVITWLSANTFSIPVNVTSGGGAAGTAASNRDTCYEVMPAIRFDTNQASAFAPDTADPRIRSFGIRAVTPHTYTAVLPASKDRMTGSLGVKDAILKLRALKSGEGVPVKEPGLNETFTGYIKDVQEKVINTAGGQPEYAIEVTISRWVI